MKLIRIAEKTLLEFLDKKISLKLLARNLLNVISELKKSNLNKELLAELYYEWTVLEKMNAGLIDGQKKLFLKNDNGYTSLFLKEKIKKSMTLLKELKQHKI